LAAALARQPNQDQLCLELDIPDDKWGKLSICQSIESMLIMLRRKHNFEERDSAVVTGEKTIVYEDDGGYNKLYISMCPDHRTSAGAGAEGCADLGAKVNRFWHYTPFALEGTRVDPEQKLMGSAQAGGVWLGDVLTHINDQDATEMTLAEIYELLSVVRTQRPLSLTFKRYARIGLAECLETWSSRENKYIALLRTCVYVEGLLEVGEEIVGCWHVKSLNEWGRSQSRIIVLSSRSYFRVNFMKSESRVESITKIRLAQILGIEAVQHDDSVTDVLTRPYTAATHNGVMIFAEENDGNTATSHAREWQALTTPQAVEHPREPRPYCLPTMVASVRLYYALSPDGDGAMVACEMYRAVYEQLRLEMEM
jgi:hypothetical protein